MLKYLAILFAFLFFSFSLTTASEKQNDRTPLAPTWPLEKLEKIIIPGKDWHPYPTFSEPDGFEKIPENIRKAYIQEGEKALNGEWAPLPASIFLDYVRNGNRSRFEHLSFSRRSRLANLVLAEVFERKGRFLDEIMNGIWAICEESFWGVPAHLGGQKAGHGLPDVTDPYVDLFSAETGELLAWTYYLLAPQLDQINPLIAKRIVYETECRILTPYLEHNDWGWMGFKSRQGGYKSRVNNWNPWINSNVIACTLILEHDAKRRLKLLHKEMDSIDNFMAPYPEDGGCDEGPSYWGRAGGSLFDCLELLYSASDGAINIYNAHLTQEIGKYIYRAYISNPYFLNFADAPAKMQIEPALVFRYGKAIGDVTMMRFAAFEAKQYDWGDGTLGGSFGKLNRILPALFSAKEILSTTPAKPLLRDVWLPDIQVMTARSEENSKESFYLAAKGGHNNESHNHNDVGNYIVYLNGQPVLVDAGSQTYTAKTFSSRRYELWNNQSGHHNLPTINGVMQHNGRQFEAGDVRYSANNKRAQLALDISKAYPEEAQVKTWQRTITLNRGKNVQVTEKYQLKKFIEPFALNFLTPLKPVLEKAGKIKLQNTEQPDASVYLLYNAKLFAPTFEKIEITDSRMSRSWGSELQQVILRSTAKDLNGQFKITIAE